MANFSTTREAVAKGTIMAQAVTNPGARLAGLFADLGHKLQKGVVTEDQLALFLKKQNPFQEVRTEQANFLTVPADLAFADRIARSQYDWHNSDITEKRFPVTAEQVGDWEWKLFHFGRNISSDEAIWLMKEEGYEAGAIGHGLTFGEKYPDEQRKYPIIMLGSVAELDLIRRVPVLWSDDDRRWLDLHWCGVDWNPIYRFLGVRKRLAA